MTYRKMDTHPIWLSDSQSARPTNRQSYILGVHSHETTGKLSYFSSVRAWVLTDVVYGFVDLFTMLVVHSSGFNFQNGSFKGKRKVMIDIFFFFGATL